MSKIVRCIGCGGQKRKCHFCEDKICNFRFAKATVVSDGKVRWSTGAETYEDMSDFEPYNDIINKGIERMKHA